MASDVQADHDWLRDRILAREGFEVMRFWNTRLDVDLEGVVDEIRQALLNQSPTRPDAKGVATPSP